MRHIIALLGLSLALPGLAAAKPAGEPAGKPSSLSFSEVLKAAPKTDWRALEQENLLYLELANGRVVMELAPQFAPQHVANIRTLAREAYFDGLKIVRSQENYVVQWGDPDEKNPRPMKAGKRSLPQEFTTSARRELGFVALPDKDGYARQTGFAHGMPAAQDGKRAWLTHCYGMVGAGRDVASDSGSGAELYVVIGHAPRHLDKNVTLLGRVVQGMPLLSTLPRGTGALGFYEKPEQQVNILSIRIGSDLPEEKQVKLEAIKSESASFKRAVEALRNRGGDWYKVPAGYVEVCNIPQMVREQQ